jgi:hypothetical protein
MTDIIDYSLQTFVRGTFYIAADHPFDPAVITDTLGVVPNYIWKQKKEKLINVPHVPQMSWGYQLPPQEYDTIDKPVNEILDTFLPLRDIIIPFVKQHRLKLCVDVLIHMYECNMDCHVVCELEPATLKRLAEFEVPFQLTHRFHYGDDVSIDD